MSYDDWLTRDPRESDVEIKMDRDVSGCGYLCEQKYCEKGATHEMQIGRTSPGHHGGPTFLLCDDHTKDIFDMYEREILCEEA